MQNLFNIEGALYRNDSFIWRTFDLGSYIVVGKPLPEDVIYFVETSNINEISRKLAVGFGTPVYDYGITHKKNKYVRVDKIHSDHH